MRGAFLPQKIRYTLGKNLFVFKKIHKKSPKIRENHRRRNGGALGARAPQDFAINKEVPFLFLEKKPLFLKEKVPSKCRAPQV